MISRGFSLVELLASLLLGLMVTLGLIQMSLKSSHLFIKARQRIQSETNIQMAADWVMKDAENVERSFWKSFPRSKEIIHPQDVLHHAFSGAFSCPNGDKGGCLTVWDLEPPDDQRIYTVLASNSPQYVDLDYVEDPLRPMPVESGSVLLLVKDDLFFAALVSEQFGSRVFLAPTHQQPWLLPEIPNFFHGFSAVNLGVLNLIHFNLKSNSPETDFKITRQEWWFDGRIWKNGRRLSAFTQIADLYLSQNPDQPTIKFELFGSVRGQTVSNLTSPVNDRQFNQEVSYAQLKL